MGDSSSDLALFNVLHRQSICAPLHNGPELYLNPVPVTVASSLASNFFRQAYAYTDYIIIFCCVSVFWSRIPVATSCLISSQHTSTSTISIHIPDTPTCNTLLQCLPWSETLQGPGTDLGQP